MLTNRLQACRDQHFRGVEKSRPGNWAAFQAEGVSGQENSSKE